MKILRFSSPKWGSPCSPRRRVHQHKEIDPQQLAADRNEGGHRGPHDLHHQQQRDAKGQPFLAAPKGQRPGANGPKGWVQGGKERCPPSDV